MIVSYSSQLNGAICMNNYWHVFSWGWMHDGTGTTWFIQQQVSSYFRTFSVTTKTVDSTTLDIGKALGRDRSLSLWPKRGRYQSSLHAFDWKSVHPGYGFCRGTPIHNSQKQPKASRANSLQPIDNEWYWTLFLIYFMFSYMHQIPSPHLFPFTKR